MDALFLDAGVLLGAVLPRDPYHERSLRILTRIAEGTWRSTHTSDYVLTEAANFLVRKRPHRDALEALLGLAFGTSESPPFVSEVLHVHSGRFAASLDLLRKQDDHRLSLTDCTTVVLLRERSIGSIATFDRGFHGFAHVVDGA